MVIDLSVLIPVYNYNITALIKELHEQCEALSIKYEIRLYDDGSSEEIKKQNKAVCKLPYVTYQILPCHLGRVGIRNKLAQEALYNYILFLDNDSQLISKNFIRNYLAERHKASVLLGGTIYRVEAPPLPYRLHWHYGRTREQRPASLRNRKPYQAFYLNNIFLAKEIFLKYPLQELLQDYGHEDSLFGLELERAGVEVCHLDNPVLHLGLEPADVYLAKTRKAVSNLYYLYKPHGLGVETKLIKLYLKLKRSGLIFIFKPLFARFEKRVLSQLQGPNPSLYLLDLYKLYLFSLNDQ